MARQNNGTTKDIRPETSTSDLPIRDMFKSEPPLGVDEDFLLQPEGDGLLFDPAVRTHVSGYGSGELSLPTTMVDSLLQGQNMGWGVGNRTFGPLPRNLAFLHDHPLYKPACDYVNKPACMTSHKATCKVLYMSVPKRKPPTLRSAKAKKPFPVGPDGKTANERLVSLLQSHPTIHRERDLWRRCNELLGLTEDHEDFVRQQSINRILKNQDSLGRSKLVAVIAEALGVRAFWLQTGRGGQYHIGDELLREYANRLSQRSN